MRTSKHTVKAFWSAMATNDFTAASEWLSEDYRCILPQTSEVIEGRANFVALNTNYPAGGFWRFNLKRIFENGPDVVTEVHITDGVLLATAITFHTVVDGLIAEQVEYCPEPYDPPEWRAKWVKVVGRQVD